MSTNIDRYSEVLLQLLSNTLFANKVAISFDDIDLEALLEDAKKQTVVAQAFESLPKDIRNKNSEVYDKWQARTFSIAQKYYTQLYANVELDKLLTKEGIPHCTLKGFVSAYYYTKPELRQMGDIDFLVSENDLKRTESLLESLGYVNIHANDLHEFHMAFSKNKNLYEMHTNIVEDKDTCLVDDVFVKNIIEDSQRISTELGELYIPNRVSHAAIMLLHMRRHMRDGDGVGLRHFADWAVFANTITEDEWTKIFEPALSKLKIKNMAIVFSKAAEMFLGMSSKAWFAGCDKKYANLLISDITRGGNFGRKEPERYKQALFIDGRNNRLVSLWHHVCNNVYCWKPFFQKYKFFLPLGVVIYVFRTAFLVSIGKRYRFSKEDIKRGTERGELYNKMFNE